MKRALLLFLLILTPCFAAEDMYQFASPAQATQFSTLTNELRCLVCQNQTIAESNAGLANDLREQIYLHIQRGETNQQIIDYLVARYGDFVLYRPPFRMSTLLLWLGPMIGLIAGLGYLIFYLRKKS